MGGTPCFEGTRVPFQTLLDYLKAGEPLDEFLDGFPSVSRDMAIAALQVAGDFAIARANASKAPSPLTDWGACQAVERHPGVVSGAWVFRGTRIPLAALFENLQSGATAEQFVSWFPGVTLQQVHTAMDHAAAKTGTEKKLNEVHSSQSSHLDPDMALHQYQMLAKDLWDDQTYFNLVIDAASPETEIWIGDDDGHLVQKEVGVLDTELVPGDYTVEFGLGTTTYPIRLMADARYTEQEIRTWPSCPRPVPRIAPE